MALFELALWEAIDTRLSADSTLTALLGNGSSSIRFQTVPPATNPSGTTYPMVVFKWKASIPDDALSTRREQIEFDIEIYVEEQPASGADGVLTFFKIRERIIGDWPEQANRTPTYGLDRWIPDFSAQTGDTATSYAGEMIVRGDARDESDFEDGKLKMVIPFKTAMDLRSS